MIEQNKEIRGFEHKNEISKDFSYIGPRLKEIRTELVQLEVKSTGIHSKDSIFSRKNISKHLDLNYKTYTNIEFQSIITNNTIKIILYFYQFGYNPNWILVKDNEFINKKNLIENFTNLFDIKDEFKEMEKTILNSISQFKSKL